MICSLNRLIWSLSSHAHWCNSITAFNSSVKSYGTLLFIYSFVHSFIHYFGAGSHYHSLLLYWKQHLGHSLKMHLFTMNERFGMTWKWVTYIICIFCKLCFQRYSATVCFYSPLFCFVARIHLLLLALLKLTHPVHVKAGVGEKHSQVLLYCNTCEQLLPPRLSGLNLFPVSEHRLILEILSLPGWETTTCEFLFLFSPSPVFAAMPALNLFSPKIQWESLNNTKEGTMESRIFVHKSFSGINLIHRAFSLNNRRSYRSATLNIVAPNDGYFLKYLVRSTIQTSINMGMLSL